MISASSASSLSAARSSCVAALGAREVLGQPGAGPEPEGVDALDVGVGRGALMCGASCFDGQAACARSGGDALAVVGGGPVGEPVDGDAAQEQVDVVLVGDADAAVHLHAVLRELGEVVAGVRLGHADRQRRGVDRPRSACRGRESASAWLASSHIFMSAKRCLISWYDASGRPKEYRLNAQSRVKSNTTWAAPTISALCTTAGDLQLVLDVGGGVRRPRRRPRRPGRRTPSNWMRAKRRTRSTLRSGVTVTPGVSGARRNWAAPASVVAVTSSWSASRARLDRRLHAGEHEVATVGLGAQGDVAEPVVRRRLGGRPGGDDVAGDDRGEDLALLLGGPGAGEGGGHDVAREQRPRRDVGAEGIGHEGEVGQRRSR